MHPAAPDVLLPNIRILPLRLSHSNQLGLLLFIGVAFLIAVYIHELIAEDSGELVAKREGREQEEKKGEEGYGSCGVR